MDNDIKYPLYRDDLFAKAKRVDDYRKLKILHGAICSMMDELKVKVETSGRPRNPRQDILQQKDKTNLRGYENRRIHLEEKMLILENKIKQDMKEL